jgi:hypothetical protein
MRASGTTLLRELVQRLPGNEHRHDDRLHRPQNNAASTRRALACTPRCAAPPMSATSWNNPPRYCQRTTNTQPCRRCRATTEKPYHEGTTHVAMSPLELMQRLAALVPRPKLHLIRFHGVLAPNAKLRPEVIPSSGRQSRFSRGGDLPVPGFRSAPVNAPNAAAVFAPWSCTPASRPRLIPARPQGRRPSCLLHLLRPGERPLPYHGKALARGIELGIG